MFSHVCIVPSLRHYVFSEKCHTVESTTYNIVPPHDDTVYLVKNVTQ